MTGSGIKARIRFRFLLDQNDTVPVQALVLVPQQFLKGSGQRERGGGVRCLWDKLMFFPWEKRNMEGRNE